jgi:hypothetical protein
MAYRTTIISEDQTDIDQLFHSIEEAKDWIRDNTGTFEPNSILCIVDFQMRETAFVKLQITVCVEDC